MTLWYQLNDHPDRRCNILHDWSTIVHGYHHCQLGVGGSLNKDVNFCFWHRTAGPVGCQREVEVRNCSYQLGYIANFALRESAGTTNLY